MVPWLQHSPRLKRGPTAVVRPAFAGVPRVCDERVAEPPAKRRWHVSPAAPAAHRVFIFITPYCGGNVVPDPMKGR